MSAQLEIGPTLGRKSVLEVSPTLVRPFHGFGQIDRGGVGMGRGNDEKNR